MVEGGSDTRLSGGIAVQRALEPGARWPALASCPEACTWLAMQADLQLAPRTVEAYGFGLADCLTVFAREGVIR